MLGRDCGVAIVPSPNPIMHIYTTYVRGDIIPIRLDVNPPDPLKSASDV